MPMKKFVNAREALYLMQRGHEMQVWYFSGDASVVLMTREKRRLKWPSFESMRKHGWLVMRRRKTDRLTIHRYGLTSRGRAALAVNPVSKR